MNGNYTFNLYQFEASTTAIYPKERGLEYTILGLCNEAGELAGVYKKAIRDNNGEVSDEIVSKLDKELGDVLWYACQIAEELGITLEMVARRNIGKLKSRQERGVLGGSGDDR
jgi:NTP pyrophosphatase (non-canonical NTP hydrolase)